MNPFENPSEVAYENLFHVGVVVSDLTEGMERMSSQLGLTWAPIRTFPVTVADAEGRTESVEVRATYSNQGPPHVELIQAAGDGLWSVGHAGGVHHFGLFVDDLETELERLESEGFVRELQGAAEPGKLSGPVYLSNSLGLRVELVGSEGKVMISDWVS